jgi:methylated-DNA-[protein]-cysteine S-methyltransferase
MTMWTMMSSPVGELRIVAGPEGLTAIEFGDVATDGVSARSSVRVAQARAGARAVGDREDAHPVLLEAVAQLDAYFRGELEEFTLPLTPEGSAFQRSVWEELRKVGYGETVTYGELARRLGMSAVAARAVGLANGRNPLPIVVPCHRVVGARGTLTGYAGGVERKQSLLDLERGALF